MSRAFSLTKARPPLPGWLVTTFDHRAIIAGRLELTQQSEISMRIDAISLGTNPPHEVNVIIEVPVGGEPIKYEMDKAAGTLVLSLIHI